MKINDELLSAFLDAELPLEQMEAVRKLLETDDALVDRLAELAQVDQWVAQNAEAIDAHPLPNSITQLLEKPLEESHQKGKVVQLSAWRKLNQTVSQHVALAAGVALVFGFTVSNWVNFSEQGMDNMVPAHIASVLDSSTSGQGRETSHGSNVRPHFSFESKDGQYCRQYQLVDQSTTTSNVACRASEGWQVIASVNTQSQQQEGQYQSASAERELDQIVDQLIKGQVLNLQQEKSAISYSWQPTLTQE